LRSQSAKNETQKKMKYRCERSHLGYRVTRVNEKYHAAVHPEPASPERVEGSKGRL